jgi:predicted alpha-1,2-mannosidase
MRCPGRGRWSVRVACVAASFVVFALSAGQADAATSGRSGGRDLASFVDPFNGTETGAPNFGDGGGAGGTYPGAVAPFGMVQWSPDTFPSTDNFAGGYSYEDRQISGFSLTHLSGAGCANYQDFPFLPTTRPISSSPVRFGSSDLAAGFQPNFGHADESATPGNYSVTLNPGTSQAVGVQLTASTRSGIGEFTFPAGSTGSVLINAGGSAMADTVARVRIDPAEHEVTGSATSGLFCYQHSSYRVYFAAQFDRPFSAYGTWIKRALLSGQTTAADVDPAAINYKPIPGGPPSISGNPSSTAQAGAYVSFDTSRDNAVGVRVAISFVSVAGAQRNLQTGPRGFDIAAARTADRHAWNRALSRIAVSGGRTADTRMFYTALYHAMLEPSVFSDADGSYMGMDGRVHSVARGHAQYANFSEWDVYRSEMPLLAMLDPTRASDMAQSLVNDAEQSGCLPKWELANGQTNTMVGDSADPILAGVHAFGAHEFDTAAALKAMVRGARVPCLSSTNGPYVERQGLAEYEALGYVPTNEDSPLNGAATVLNPAAVWGSASTTLEYATDDFALSRLAASLGDESEARQYLARSGDWRNLFDSKTGYIEPRSVVGSFPFSFDPAGGTGYVEGTGGQYTWMVPFDLVGLAKAMGGRSAAAKRLDSFFTKLNAGPAANHAYLGNEPTLEAPWEYDWLGEPYRTQAVVRKALLTLYSTRPTGFPGNDDLGEMSSWWVLGALGLYPEIPGTGVLALGSPLFPHETIHLGSHALRITAKHAGDHYPYVRSLRLDGRSWRRPWLRYSSIAGGGRLRFVLGQDPDQTWGAAPAEAPPSYAG